MKKKAKRTLMIFIILILLVLYAGDIKVLAYRLYCGNAPIIATRFAASFSYDTPGSPAYPGSWDWFPAPLKSYFLISVDDFFCTEEEAQEAHYRPSSFN